MNQVILVGRIAKDPEIRYTPQQLAVAGFTVAVNRPEGKREKENQIAADFIDVTAFGKSAELVERFFKKGRWIGVQGRIQNNNYTNKKGEKVYSYQVVADRVEFVGNKDSNAESKNNSDVPEGFSELDEAMPF